MKTRIHLLLGALLLLTLTAVPAAARKPNILLIYTDDHGWADLGAQGVNADIRTPNLDQLARDGVRFARGYVSAPQCVPSRAGVITGRYQQKFGVEDNTKGPLPLGELTIAERLKPAGYVTGMVGKWHLDHTETRGGGTAKKAARMMPPHMPQGQGFDEYWRGEMRRYYASHDLSGKPFADAPHLVSDDRFRVVVQTEAALGYLDRRGAKPEQPWFLYLAWFAPHVPLESPEPWFAKTPENLPLPRRQALAMIAAMDDGLGRIREKLRAMGQEQDTLIVFIGDNGAPLGKAWDGSLNHPMIGQKGMLSEGGIRTPFVAAWPGKLPADMTYDQPVISLDVAATAVALAGLPHDKQLDGVNLIPFVTGENKGAPHDALYWRWGSQAAVLEMPYKLIILGDRERLLFDITQPDGENNGRNLVTSKPDVAARLEAKLKSWSETLRPPGLPTKLNPHHEAMFAGHDLIATIGNPKAKTQDQPAATTPNTPVAPNTPGAQQRKVVLPGGAPNDATAMLLLDSGTAKVGINRAMGASITWLSAKDYPKNMVNSSDPGRLIQQSYYAGNRLNRQADGQSKSWSPWPWNPIQGGGVASWARVSEFRRLDTATLFSETVPKLWDMPNEEAAALMRQWTGFEPGMPNVITVRCELLVKRDENDRWGPPRPAHQEVPACYFTRNFDHVKTYLGNGQWREESQPPGPPWGRLEPPRKAVALFNANGQGVAVFSPAATEKWNFGPHAGGLSDDPAVGPCMHVAPISLVRLGPQSNYRYRYWLMVGTEKELSASLDRLWEKHANERAELTNPDPATDSNDPPTKN